MPIVVCSGCSAKLNAPDNAAGKRIKCPKCQTVTAVPAATVAAAPQFEIVEDDSPPAPKPKPVAVTPPKVVKPVARAVVDDDDEEDRPRGRRKDVDDDRP